MQTTRKLTRGGLGKPLGRLSRRSQAKAEGEGPVFMQTTRKLTRGGLGKPLGKDEGGRFSTMIYPPKQLARFSSVRKIASTDVNRDKPR